MLVLKRKEGQWVDVTHRSGDVIRIRVCNFDVAPSGRPCCNMAFDDAPRNFEIQRPESSCRPHVEGYEEQASAALASPDSPA